MCRIMLAYSLSPFDSIFGLVCWGGGGGGGGGAVLRLNVIHDFINTLELLMKDHYCDRLPPLRQLIF